MFFFFGSSRSWAAKEARRKARLLAKKRRRSIIQATVVIFSIMIFSVSMWSLRKMRLSALSIRHAAHRNNGTYGYGRVLDGSVKTAVSALHTNVDMPKPPLEPDAPSKMDKSSSGTGIKKEGLHESGGTVNSQGMVAAESKNGAIGSSQQSSLSQESSSQETPHRNYRTKDETREANSNPAVRGMTQEDATSVHHDASNGHDTRTVRTNEGGEVGKMGEIDVLDSEEGGEGLVVTLPMKKSEIDVRYRQEGSEHPRENFMIGQRDHLEGRHQSGRSLDSERVSRHDKYQGETVGDGGFARGLEKVDRKPVREYRHVKESTEGVKHSQGFGGVYRDVKTDGNDSEKMDRIRNGERVVTSNVDVTNSGFRNGVSSMG